MTPMITKREYLIWKVNDTKLLTQLWQPSQCQHGDKSPGRAQGVSQNFVLSE